MAVKLTAFGGMIPAQDRRILPQNNAETAINTWLYNGGLEGIRLPSIVHTLVDPAARYVYRVPQLVPDAAYMSASYWLEFQNLDTTVVKSPVAGSSDPAYYWADGVLPPGYTTLSRLAAASAALLLGIPAPTVAPTVVPAGGVSALTDTRAYVYTWVSAYGEESAPSPPTVVTGKIDDTWAIGLTAVGGVATDRNLTKSRIYRTVTSAQGTADYYLVIEIAIATLAYNDNAASSDVVNNGAIISTNFTPPPGDLKGIVTMANGMLVGWRANEVWFSEPYRPHAWPANYVLLTDYEIVGMAAIGQAAVVCTQSTPYVINGTAPTNTTMSKIAAVEPCLSRGSITASPDTVYFASSNGLIAVSAGGLTNITKNLLSKDKWQLLVTLRQLRAALLNGAYYSFSGVQEQSFQADSFQTDSFQQAVVGTTSGAFFDFSDPRVAFSLLQNATPTYNVIQDPWSGEVLLIRDGSVQVLLTAAPAVQGSYTWRSKLFDMNKPLNLGACKITWETPANVSMAAATFNVYADGVLRSSRPLPISGNIVRLPSGFLANNYQFEIIGNLLVKSIEVAATPTELRSL